MAKRQLSEAAKTAAAIRKHLKKNGIKARVRSKNFSMGNSVTVTVTDLLPATVKAIKEYCSQYQYGHFDGMTDLYEYSNNRDDIPQAKYVSVNAEYSDALRQEAWSYIRGYYADFADAGKSLQDANSYWGKRSGESGSMMIWRILGGNERSSKFWSDRKPRIVA